MSSILNKELIFSDDPKYRLRRHLLFWCCWYFYFAAMHAANPFGRPEISYFRSPVYTFTESIFFILVQIPPTYLTLYLILPKLILKKKYLYALLACTVLWFVTGTCHLGLSLYVFPKLMAAILPDYLLEKTQRPPSASFFMAVLANGKGNFTIVAFALLIKFGKHWYLKEQRNLQLQKENTVAQLQLLTAQIHPHFLFNTLNNIYSQTQTESPKGSRMIMEMSDILRYILYEGQKSFVPIRQELSMISEYINLEKIRYGNKLDVQLAINVESDELVIAPLLLLPFIENCFKHGTSNMLRNPWISLSIETKDTTLVMKLINGKPRGPKPEAGRSGIGINNVTQRLEALYGKEKYDLKITEDEDVFIVDLSIELSRMKNDSNTKQFTAPEISYA